MCTNLGIIFTFLYHKYKMASNYYKHFFLISCKTNLVYSTNYKPSGYTEYISKNIQDRKQ